MDFFGNCYVIPWTAKMQFALRNYTSAVTGLQMCSLQMCHWIRRFFWHHLSLCIYYISATFQKVCLSLLVLLPLLLLPGVFVAISDHSRDLQTSNHFFAGFGEIPSFEFGLATVGTLGYSEHLPGDQDFVDLKNWRLRHNVLTKKEYKEWEDATKGLITHSLYSKCSVNRKVHWWMTLILLIWELTSGDQVGTWREEQ